MNHLVITPRTSGGPNGVPLGYSLGALGSIQNLVKSKILTNGNFYICFSEDMNHLIISPQTPGVPNGVPLGYFREATVSKQRTVK